MDHRKEESRPRVDLFAKVYYLASPFSHADEQMRAKRVKDAALVTAAFHELGVLVYSPIVHYACLGKLIKHFGWDHWQRFDKAMLARCDRMFELQLPGHAESQGMKAEKEFATLSHTLTIPLTVTDAYTLSMSAAHWLRVFGKSVESPSIKLPERLETSERHCKGTGACAK